MALPAAGPTERLWRARRRHDHVDALLLDPPGGPIELRYHLNDRPMLAWRFASREEAAAEADRRLQELLRAGWTLHW
jgi:hypothetical protein